MFRNQSVNAHAFSMVPRADIPRSSFRIQKSHKTTFDSGYLIPFYVDEVLPGDTFNLTATMFIRMATPIFPIMDNLYIDTQWFFVPNRLIWDNFQRFMGEQPNPGDTTDFLIPIGGITGGYAPLSLQDYMGLPTIGQVDPAGVVNHNVLPLRAYNLIWNEWYRDQNLQDAVVVNKGDGPDGTGDYTLLKRGKRHDYFTSCLPWTQKGEPVLLPLGESAPVYTFAGTNVAPTLPASPLKMFDNSTWNSIGSLQNAVVRADGLMMNGSATGLTEGAVGLVPVNLFTDLTEATAATINQIRQAFQIQRLLERDARGGTRYTEWTRSHFGVISPDARLQRPEYLGGNTQSINISPVAQTSGTDSVAETPQGNLAAFSATVARNGFTQSFTEHGYIIGLCSVRADLTYQQGLRKMWSRRTKYDLYVPVFAMLGEQAVLNKEIFCTGLAADEDVFGYQERWAEYRYNPSMITGLFKSTSAGAIDNWHLSQHFTALPTLNAEFIEEAPPVERALAVGSGAGGQQFICDIFTDNRCSRCMPMYSVPGMVDHF